MKKKLFILLLICVAIVSGALALSGCGHKHNLTYTPAKSETCTTDGNSQYWACTDCSKYFSDENAQNEITLSSTITKATGHTERTLQGKAATCTENGLTDGKECSVCGTVMLAQQTIPAAHKYIDTIVAPTKVERGFTKHDCTVCDYSYVDTYVSAIGSIGLAYVVNDDATCTITGLGDCEDTEVFIPEAIENLPVTAIADSAFSNCTTITKLDLPQTIISIGSRAFYGCMGLTEFTMPESVTNCGTQIFYKSNIETVYWNSDYGDGRYKPIFNIASIKKIVFGSTIINSSVCYDCTNIVNVEILDTVKEIHYDAFKNCSSLISVTIANSVTDIEQDAFSGCTSLENIYYGGNVGEWLNISGVGRLMFIGKSNKNVYFKNQLVTDITIPNGVTVIESSAFESISSLKSVVIPNSVTTIRDSAFSGCTSLTSLTIPDSVTIIRNSALFGCTSLTRVIIPDSVLRIENEVFSGCTSLISITIPDSVTSIGSSAFSGCTSLISITIPDGVTRIEDFAFSNCSSLAQIILPDSVIYIGQDAFAETKFCKDSENFINGLLYINKHLIVADNTLCGNVIIREGTITIANGSFYNCNSIKSIIIPNTVTNIGYCTFYNCSSLESIVIPSSITNIDAFAFYLCGAIKTVYFGGNAEEWNTLTIDYTYNGKLPYATLYYYSEKEPTEEGNYWHYGTDGVTPVKW